MTNRLGPVMDGGSRNGAPGGGSFRGRPDASHLRELVNFIQRNRALVLGVPAAVMVAAILFVYLAVPIYQADSWIRIDEQKSNLPVLEALQTISSGEQIQTELAVLQRRPLAEEVVDSLGLNLVVSDPARVPRQRLMEQLSADRSAPARAYRLEREESGFVLSAEDSDAPLGRYSAGQAVVVEGARFRLTPEALDHDAIEFELVPFDDAVRGFRETLGVTRPDRDADLLRLRYQSPDRIMVRDIPNTLARFFIRQRQDVRKTEARSTVVFLREQIGTMSGQLVEAEDELRRFRERENIVDLETEGEVKVSRFAELRAERDMLNTERQALADMLQAATVRAEAVDDPLAPSPYRDLIAFPSLFANFAVGELYGSLATVENQRAELLNRRRPADPDVEVLTGRIKGLERQLRNITVTYLEGLTQQVAGLNEDLAEFRQELGAVPAKEVQYARLMRQAEVLDEIYTLLQTRLHEAQIAAAVEDPSVRIVEPAAVPVDPIKPSKPLSLVLALVLGLALGGGAAFLRENMDTSIHTREDLQEVAPALPVLGLIPRIPEAATNGARPRPGVPLGAAADDLSHRLIAGRDPRSPVSEAYRSMRTNISFSSLDRPQRTLVFTSALPGDGKSTSASNLAITFAQQGQRCLLVDADMRRGVLHEVFGELRAPGLSDVLVGEVDVDEAIRQVDLGESGTLAFLSSGTLPPNPAELVGSDRTRRLLQDLSAKYDTVILDAPPLNLVTDAALLGTGADGVVVVARSGVTERGAVSYALDQLAAVKAHVIGAVLNDIDVRKDRFYGSYGMASYERYAAEAEKART